MGSLTLVMHAMLEISILGPLPGFIPAENVIITFQTDPHKAGTVEILQTCLSQNVLS